MPELVDLISPQISITEEDQTQYNEEVTGPAGAIILRNTWRGRENDTILVTTETDLITKFGFPTAYAPCYCDMFSAIGFLKSSNNLYCTRVMPVSSTFSGTKATVGTSATFSEMTSATAYKLGSGVGAISDPDTFADEVACSDPYVMYVIAAYRGYSGNYLRVAVCDKTNYDLIRQKLHASWDTYSAIRSVDSQLESTKEFLVIVQECTQGSDTTVESNWNFVEAWNVSTEETKVDDLSQAMYVESKINENSDYIRVTLNPTYRNQVLANFTTSSWQRLGGGTNTDNVGIGVDGNEAPSTAVMDAAINLYANAEDNTINVFIDGDKPNVSKLTMMQVCNTRKDCMFIPDCLSASVVNNVGNEADDLVTWSINLYSAYSDFNSSYGATYGTWIDIKDKYANRYRWVPFSGYAAGVYVKCVDAGGLAPAGLNRARLDGIRRLAWNPSLVERDEIYKHNVNSVVSLAGQGKYIWTQKTMLQKESIFGYVHGRLTFLILEKKCADVSKYYLQEPNTAIKRQQFLSDITPIFADAKGKGLIEDFKLVCDDSNNTAETIAKGELRGDFFVKPVYAVTYIRLRFVGTKTGTSFAEA